MHVVQPFSLSLCIYIQDQSLKSSFQSRFFLNKVLPIHAHGESGLCEFHGMQITRFFKSPRKSTIAACIGWAQQKGFHKNYIRSNQVNLDCALSMFTHGPRKHISTAKVISPSIVGRQAQNPTKIQIGFPYPAQIYLIPNLFLFIFIFNFFFYLARKGKA